MLNFFSVYLILFPINSVPLKFCVTNDKLIEREKKHNCFAESHKSFALSDRII